MSNFDFDLLVIGAGSGGVRAARLAGDMGIKTAVVEAAALGGTCVNLGCVPKKLFVYAAHFREDFEDAAGYGWSVGQTHFDWPTLRANKNHEIARLNGIYEKLLTDAKVQIIRGFARFADPHIVEVDGQRYRAKRILIATGSEPTRPSIEGNELGIVSDDAFYLEKLPQQIVIVGGGYIAMEFACIFHNLGVQVAQLYRRDLFLRGFDKDMRQAMAEMIRGKGIDLRFNTNVTALKPYGEGVAACLTDGGELHADAVMFATGRRPRVQDLNLEAAGVQLHESEAVKVDAYSQTTAEHIYAVGDVTDRMNLTPVAIAEAVAFVETVYRGNPTAMDHANVPHAVFAQPPLACVGLTEDEAKEKHGKVDVYRSQFRPMKNTLSGREEKTLLKMIVDCKTDRVVGAHMLGPDAAEIIQGIAIAIQCGATKRQFDATVGIHPTTAEEWVTMR